MLERYLDGSVRIFLKLNFITHLRPLKVIERGAQSLHADAAEDDALVVTAERCLREESNGIREL